MVRSRRKPCIALASIAVCRAPLHRVRGGRADRGGTQSIRRRLPGRRRDQSPPDVVHRQVPQGVSGGIIHSRLLAGRQSVRQPVLHRHEELPQIPSPFLQRQLHVHLCGSWPLRLTLSLQLHSQVTKGAPLAPNPCLCLLCQPKITLLAVHESTHGSLQARLGLRQGCAALLPHLGQHYWQPLPCCLALS